MTKRILIATAIVALVLVTGWYEGLYRPEAKHITKLDTQEQAASSALMGLETKYAGLVSSEKRLPGERVALAELKRAVPEGPELDNLVTTLFSAASAAKVELTSIGSPQPSYFGVATGAASLPGLPQIDLSLSVSGTAYNIEHLVRILDSEPRLLVVDDFGLTFSSGYGNQVAGGAGSVGSTTINLRAFYASAASATPGS